MPSAPTCDDAASGPPFPNPLTRSAAGSGAAAARPPSTPRPASSATPSNGPSAASASTAPSPPGTTSATSCTAAPSTPPRSGSGSATSYRMIYKTRPSPGGFSCPLGQTLFLQSVTYSHTIDSDAFGHSIDASPDPISSGTLHVAA